MSSKLFLALIVGAALATVVTVSMLLPSIRFIADGVFAGLFSLLGVFFGLVYLTLAERLTRTLVVLFCLGYLYLAHTNGNNGWELLLFLMRFVVVAGACSHVRRSKKVVFSDQDSLSELHWKPLKLSYLFGLTFFVALFLGFTRVLKLDVIPQWNFFVAVFIVPFGLFVASIPLVTALGVVGERSFNSTYLYVIAILMMSICVGDFVYSQSDSFFNAATWVANSVMESMTVAGVLIFFRGRSHCLRKMQSSGIYAMQY